MLDHFLQVGYSIQHVVQLSMLFAGDSMPACFALLLY